jgi:hypothetical protein
MSDLFVFDRDIKVVNTIQDRDRRFSTLLLNSANIIKDTVSPGLPIYQILPVPDQKGKYRLVGRLSFFNLEVVDNSIQKSTSVVAEDTRVAEFTTEFAGCLVTLAGNRVLQVERNEDGKFSSSSAINTLFEGPKKSRLDRKNIYQLPARFGLGEYLYLFVRDAQTLLVINDKWQVKEIPIAHAKNEVFSYFFDSVSRRHHLIKSADNQPFQIFDLNLKTGELKFIRETEDHPREIFDYQYFVCKGNRKKNCDYYAYPLYAVDEKPPVQVLSEVFIDN